MSLYALSLSYICRPNDASGNGLDVDGVAEQDDDELREMDFLRDEALGVLVLVLVLVLASSSFAHDGEGFWRRIKDDDAAAEKFPHGEVCYSYSKYLKGIFGNYVQILKPSIYAK